MLRFYFQAHGDSDLCVDLMSEASVVEIVKPTVDLISNQLQVAHPMI